MHKKEMKKVLKSIAKPVKKELFNEVGYNAEELLLMKYLYLDKINQSWISDEIGISIPTLTKMHNGCIDQLISYFYFEKYKQDHMQENSFDKYFRDKF